MNLRFLALVGVTQCVFWPTPFLNGQPWLTNTPIASVQKELYLAHVPNSGVAVWDQQYNAGPNLQRIEIRGNEQSSDSFYNITARVSNDNGVSWSSVPGPSSFDVVFNPSAPAAQQVHGFEGTFLAMPAYHPQAQVLIQPWDRQVYRPGGTLYDFAYYRISADNGQTWTQPMQLKYEAGPNFNPDDPLNANFLGQNNGYMPVQATVTSTGKVVLASGNAKPPAGGPAPGSNLFGAVSFVGTWNGQTGAAADFTWQASNRITVSPTYVNATTPVSSRGLAETNVAELQDGRMLYVWRGSNSSLSGTTAKSAAGHKWLSIGTLDGGTNGSPTLGPLQELKYITDTGQFESFFSPSSHSRLFRFQGNGKLYWIGNITPGIPSGNLPRHPLVIAEVDEANVALKKSTVTLITDQEAGDQASLQLSNFSLLEDPLTHHLEILLTNYGALSSSADPLVHPNLFDADVYKYTLTFPNLPVIVPGDYDKSGSVDAGDYILWRKFLNTPSTHGVWRQHFGETAAIGAADNASVPETSEFALKVLAVAGFSAVRRR
jgi:hypothetical protein